MTIAQTQHPVDPLPIVAQRSLRSDSETGTQHGSYLAVLQMRDIEVESVKQPELHGAGADLTIQAPIGQVLGAL